VGRDKKEKEERPHPGLRRPTGYQPRAVFGEACTEDEDARSSSVIIPGGVGSLIPEIRDGGGLSSTNGGEGILLGIEVSEIHTYPLRREGFEETLFPTAASKRAVAEHLLEAPWLSRASELEGKTGGAAHALEEPVELRKSPGRTEIVRLGEAKRRCHSSWTRQRVVRVLDRWRQVSGWWDANRRVDRMVFRILLSGGAVVDLARERSGDWLLVGVVD
jgi:hypothetical protein